MKFRLGVIGLGLAILLGESLALSPKGSAQENSTKAPSRQVRVRAMPDYPSLARQLKFTGKVKIEATVTPEGRVTTIRVIGGSPLLVPSAIDAVKKWRFEAASKETTEIVEFEFNGQIAK
ncbi:MAG TPA: energy transducer TonB [Candidatus Acidoferrales bacterium]|jgi:TonB family protein|nr:energy transducer TonB [Candidatus Acidoferrales bacterium]